MQITFLSRDQEVIDELKKHLGDNFFYLVKDIRVKSDFDEYDVLISPANSFGEIQGGIDMQYYINFGRDKLQEKIYKEIQNKYNGEILVGEFCPIRLEESGKILLLCPTMTVPMDVSQTRNAYYFTRAFMKGLHILEKAGYNINKVLCPVPCVGVGGMSAENAAKQIKAAIDAMNKTGVVYNLYKTDSILQQAKMMCIAMLRNY